MKAKKSLGQHFLRSEKALRTIVDTSGVNEKDIVLEIGPGKGDLTARLLSQAGKVIAVEKDDELFKFLQEKFISEIESGKLELIHGDILEFDPKILRHHKNFTYKIVANIPYNITGAIIRKFLSADFQPVLMTLLVQKEVAERIVARNDKESILSISVKAYGNPRYIETVKAGSFAPAPKVDSAIITIEHISKDFFTDFSEEFFFSVLHAGFASKRKKLSSNLSVLLPKENVAHSFQALNLGENIRAENMSIDKWRNLTQILKNRAD